MKITAKESEQKHTGFDSTAQPPLLHVRAVHEKATQVLTRQAGGVEENPR